MILYILLLNVFTIAYGDPTFKNYDFVEDLNAFYKYYDSKKFDDAVGICKKDGAQLVVPKSEYEMEYLTNRYDRFWIGVNNRVNYEQYHPIDASDPADMYLRWVGRHPLSDKGNCGFMVKFGLMKSAKCYLEVPFVCEKSLGVPNYTKKVKPVFRNDYIYVNRFNNFYKLYEESWKFSEAVSQCLSDGATLLIPRSYNESLFARVISQSDFMWIGIHDRKIEGQFETIDGSNISTVYNKWKEYEPRPNDRFSNCVALTFDEESETVKCDRKFSFICQASPNDIKKWDQICETFTAKYSYYKSTNRCYKYHSESKNWDDALKGCLSENATLLTINSELEANHVKNIILDEAQLSAVAFHSGFESSAHGKFVTTEGLFLEKIKHNIWAPGYPKFSNKKFYCGAFNRDTQLININCKDKNPYICVKYTSQ